VDPARGEQTDQGESVVSPAPATESGCVGSPKHVSSVSAPNGNTTIVAIPVDPYVVHCQWEIAPADLEAVKRALGVTEHEYWPALQFYDVTDSPGNDVPPSPSFSVDVQLAAENWYIRSCAPERCYRADLVLKREDGSLAVIASSDRVETPPSGPSNYADEQWPPIRLSPPLPENAPPIEPASQVRSEAAVPLVRWPIDMREEVVSKLRALYGEQDRDVTEPRQQIQLPTDRSKDSSGEMTGLQDRAEPQGPSSPLLPVDMREEVSLLLSQVYEGTQMLLSAPARGSPILGASGGRGVGTRPNPSAADPVADLTEWNESNFTSGVFSR
jgi:hypothetical protein